MPPKLPSRYSISCFLWKFWDPLSVFSLSTFWFFQNTKMHVSDMFDTHIYGSHKGNSRCTKAQTTTSTSNRASQRRRLRAHPHAPTLETQEGEKTRPTATHSTAQREQRDEKDEQDAKKNRPLRALLARAAAGMQRIVAL